ncbi:hypothetical protein BC629DRAFT_1542753 [Irpex lacteus]|nr:hypothetical protein BC629DRAFT_1542753 [Irpex lacteus]
MSRAYVFRTNSGDQFLRGRGDIQTIHRWRVVEAYARAPAHWSDTCHSELQRRIDLSNPQETNVFSPSSLSSHHPRQAR